VELTLTEPHHRILLFTDVVWGFFLISSQGMVLIKIALFSPVTFCVIRSPHTAVNIYGASVSPPHKCHGRHVGIFMAELAVVTRYRHDWHAVSGLTNIGPYHLTFVTECKGGILLHMHFVT
jgi:hypothetical protein